MADIDTICGPSDIAKFFTRSQHNLGERFFALKPIMGIWGDRITDLGLFPNASGWAARTTTLGFRRVRMTDLNFNPMVGLQDDCATSCDTPATIVPLGGADNQWYRMTNLAMNTPVFCLQTMWGDALNLREQVENIITNLRGDTEFVFDEFKRRNFAAIAANKWLGLDGGTAPRRGLWNFATDANGTVNVDYIELDASITDPRNIVLPSVDIFNAIVETGSYNGGFEVGNRAQLITDYQTQQQLSKFDTNVRADNRLRQPSVLNPALGSVTSYANFDMPHDPFALRYIWTEDDPNYPGGVLKRVDAFTDQQVSEGCWDDVSDDYLNADFIVHIFYNDRVFGMQNMSLPTNLPGGTYDQRAAPYNGMWHFYNEINEVTPCNVDRNKAFWRMKFNKAAKPMYSGKYGHVVLTRRFGGTGLVKACRELITLSGAYYDCDNTCPPLDWSPPALIERTTCGSWNEDAVTGCSVP